MEITSKMIKISNSFGFTIPMAFVRCKVLDPTKKYVLKIEEVEEANVITKKKVM